MKYWEERLRHWPTKEITMADKYNILRGEVEKAEKVLAEAQRKLDLLNEEKTISPKEVIEELERMTDCREWQSTPVKKLGVILVRNIFNNREAKKQQDRDDYDRDY